MANPGPCADCKQYSSNRVHISYPGGVNQRNIFKWVCLSCDSNRRAVNDALSGKLKRRSIEHRDFDDVG
jgi:hypothetical protein